MLLPRTGRLAATRDPAVPEALAGPLNSGTAVVVLPAGTAGLKRQVLNWRQALHLPLGQGVLDHLAFAGQLQLWCQSLRPSQLDQNCTDKRG